MPVNEIPLNPYPENFGITLDDKEFSVTTTWNVPSQTWTITLSDSVGNPILGGVPLIPGVDLLAQYPYLGFVGKLVAQVDHDQNAVPSYDGLGSTGHLYYITP